jgi:hypothetical protein
MVTATDAPAIGEPAGEPVVADAPRAENSEPSAKLKIVGIVVGAVVVAGALFGGGVLVGMNINGSSQSQTGTGGFQGGQQGGFQGGQQGGGFGDGGRQGGFGGQQGTQNGGQQGTQGGTTTPGTSNS